jgi:predicted molibdopterin-dependent oxidoreductase YjgC
MAERLVDIIVNGKELEVPAGTLLIHVLEEQGVTVPTLCHDERLTPYGGCRVCCVARRDGRGGLVPACSTPVQRGMEIETDTEDVVDSRRKQLQLLVLNHRMECPVCERNGDCRFQDLIYEYGVGEDLLPFERVMVPRDERSPIIVRDPEKCVICGKCVRICDEIQGEAAIGLVNRGLEAHVSTFLDKPLDCEFCGQCVNACPVGALVARPFVTEAPAWLRQRTTTTCSLCSCGCQVGVETFDGHIHTVKGDDVRKEPNHGNLCVKGWLGWDLLSSEERLTEPMVRKNGRLEATSWREALERAAELTREARDGGEPIVGVATSRMTTEDGYLMQRMMRDVLGTPHVMQAPIGGPAALDGMWDATGTPASTAKVDEIQEADVVLVLRGDPKRTHPIVKNEIVESVKHRGQRLVLAHALSGGLEQHAELFLDVVPGSEDALVSGMAAGFAEQRPDAFGPFVGGDGLEAWKASLTSYSPEAVAEATGLPAAQLEKLLEILLSARRMMTVIVTGNGVPGDERATAAAAARLTAMVNGDPSASQVLVLGEKANVQGLMDVGVSPSWLPGHRRVENEQARAQVAQVWGGDVPHGPGWGSPEVAQRCASGEVGLLYMVGCDPLSCWARKLEPRRMLEGARRVIVQDAFLTPAARMADVVLPVAILGERKGSLIGSDGTRRELHQAVPTPAPLPQDGELFVELAHRLGAELPTGDALAGEMEQLVRWPVEVAPVKSFEALGKPTPGEPVGRCLLDAAAHLFHSGQTTTHSPSLQHLSPTIAIRMNREDALELGVRNGELIQIAAGENTVMGRARIDRHVRPGRLILPCQQSADGSTNMLFDEQKVVGVEVRRCS